MDIGDICIAGSATTHTILQNEKYFSHLTIAKANIGTISGTSNLIEGSGMASFVLSNGTQMHITDVTPVPYNNRYPTENGYDVPYDNFLSEVAICLYNLKTTSRLSKTIHKI
ncbi:hypothetical protein CFOL_v3_02923 [Cephalotus follicularis]|uniref:Uncharacterized protein n=1 Tax=Cephalotus follicularis TaxID=3775 RepID=A0A1Q3AUY4_CEPFO|nr:hypothetical protein CFOL_v3_02923 [Cephalotus follicularis]